MAHVHICVLLSSSFAFADGQSPAPDSVQDPGITRNMEPVSAGKRLLGIVPNYRTSPRPWIHYADNRTDRAAVCKLAVQIGIDTAANVLKESWLDWKRRLHRHRK